MSSVVYMECSECAVPVCDDGPLRAVLLVPCQHVLHAGCAEFSLRRARARCPACRAPVQRVVPLFPSGGGACGDDPRVAAAYRAVHSAQRSAAAQLRALHSARERVAGLSAQCAALHSRRAAAQHEAERIARAMECAEAFGPGGPSCGASSGAPRHTALLCVEGMAATELELFIAQSAPALARLERDVRHVRRAVQRRRAKVSEARAKCRSAQAARAEREKGEEKQQQEKEEEKEKEKEKEEGEREGTEGRAGSSGSVQCAGSESPSRGNSRDREDNGDNGDNGDSGRRERGKRKRPPPPPPFVDVDESGGSDAGDDVVIVAQRPAPRGSSSHHHQQQQQQQQQEEKEKEKEEDEDEDEEGIALYVPQLVTPAKRTVNFSRLLPRREDRLWQPSLDEVL